MKETAPKMKLDIPSDLQDSFKRLMKSVYPENRKSLDFQKTTLIYLSLGGEKLARYNIETAQMDFPNKSSLFEYAPIIEPVTDTDVDKSQSDDNE
jgi:hypothetical protein